jgi:hypothetical protein
MPTRDHRNPSCLRQAPCRARGRRLGAELAHGSIPDSTDRGRTAQEISSGRTRHRRAAELRFSHRSKSPTAWQRRTARARQRVKPYERRVEPPGQEGRSATRHQQRDRSGPHARRGRPATRHQQRDRSGPHARRGRPARYPVWLLDLGLYTKGKGNSSSDRPLQQVFVCRSGYRSPIR